MTFKIVTLMTLAILNSTAYGDASPIVSAESCFGSLFEKDSAASKKTSIGDSRDLKFLSNGTLVTQQESRTLIYTQTGVVTVEGTKCTTGGNNSGPANVSEALVQLAKERLVYYNKLISQMLRYTKPNKKTDLYANRIFEIEKNCGIPPSNEKDLNSPKGGSGSPSVGP